MLVLPVSFDVPDNVRYVPGQISSARCELPMLRVSGVPQDPLDPLKERGEVLDLPYDSSLAHRYLRSPLLLRRPFVSTRPSMRSTLG